MDFYRNLLFMCVLGTLFAVNFCIEDIPEVNDVTETTSTTLSPTDYLLPTNAYPTSYEILLMPDLDKSTFTGIAKINVTIKQSTNTITLHHGDIVISSVTAATDKDSLHLTTAYDKATEKYSLKLVSTLEAGTKITLALAYTGTLNDRNIGFYRSSYYDENGVLRYLAATQFQATHARHAFPCFDEPKFKATFKISIQRNQKYVCLSNMKLEKSLSLTQKSDLFWDTFEQSIPMSTYLVAFAIGELESLEKGNFAVWTRSNAILQAEYALDVGTRSLDYLATHFKQDYQLSKMDMFAVPDFAAGAMENWGLVKYRETRMLYTEEDSSIVAQQTVASVIVHELTHMWFGNQVTPAWWGYLWLSEAFANYYQYFGTSKIQPSMETMEQFFVVEQYHKAFAADALESSKPLTREVYTQSEIGTMGDTITYSKGGSIVRMMNLIFGSENFDRGIRNYLKNNKETGLGKPEDLWFALQNEIETYDINFRVQTVMDTWTLQSGYPVVNILIENGKATLTQSRFLLRNLESTPTNDTWWIPITWTNDNFDLNTLKNKLWFNEREITLHLGSSPNDLIIFNVQQSGFYRVNYDNATWHRIIDVLRSDEYERIHVLNRAGILDDLLNLARAGQLNYETALEGLEYIKNETNYICFKAAFNALDYLNRRFAGSEHDTLYQEHVLSLFKDIYKKLGYFDTEQDDRLSAFLRIDLNSLACKFEHEGCLLMSRKLFKEWMENNIATIHPNQRSTVYCSAIKQGAEEEWQFLWNQYQTTNSATEQTVILSALGCSRDKAILEKYLGSALTGYEENRIRKQDSSSVFSAVYSSSLFGAEYILEFIDKHHADITKYGGIDMIASIISGASQRFSTKELIDKFEQFIEAHSTEFEPILNSLKSSLNLARYEYDWYQRNSDPIASWIIKNNGKDAEHNKTTTVFVSTPSTTKSTTPSIRPPTEPVTEPTTPDPVTEPTTTPTAPVTQPTTPDPVTEPTTTPTAPVTQSTTPDPVTEPTTPPDDDTSDTEDYRLPSSIVPTHYDILLVPHLEPNFTFDGTVDINVEFKESSDKIVLHMSEIEYHKVTVTAKGSPIKNLNITYSQKYEFLQIQLPSAQEKGTTLAIHIEYQGILNREMRGFYRSYYIDNAGDKRWLAATHLEPVAARKMFPCFDEPGLKATFTIVTQVPQGYHAISNMPLSSVTAAPNNASWYTFDKTPKMSTYLVALLVSDFEQLSDAKKIYSTWARSSAIDQTEYAQSVMEPLVKYFEKMFRLPYQIPKLDMVALPDFASGAMENWGLITYKESNLIYDENETAISVKQSVANVISHEIAHQWFGNLVSPSWWKHVWLSEGFARYFQYHATISVEADWSLESQFIVEQLHSAFGTDGLTSSHPMTHDVWTNAQIRGIFDTISYAKSASVLRMLEKTFGHDVFYNALNAYLVARQYDVSVPEDLYSAFQKFVNESDLPSSIPTIMDTWTTQAGYPVLHVSRSRLKIHVRQERFLLRNPKNKPIDQTWYVPITWTSQVVSDFETTTPRHWLSGKTLDIDLDDIDAGNQWHIFNIQQAGYYRVNYERSMLLRLITHLQKEDKFETIPEVSRAALMDDIMNLARAGYIEYDLVLDAMEYLAHERSYIPWRAFFNALPYLQKRFQGRGIHDLFKKHARVVMKNTFDDLTFYDNPNDSHTTLLLRRHLRQWYCEMEDPSCTLKASALFRMWEQGSIKTIPANYRSVVYCEAMKNATYKTVDIMLDLFTTSNVAADKVVILKAMGCARDKDKINLILEAAIDESSGIRYQDSMTVFSAVYDSGPIGVESTMDFIKRYYDNMVDYFGDNSNIKSIINGISQRLSTLELYYKFVDFSNWILEKDQKLSDSLQSYKSRALYELSWYNKTSPILYKWLETRYPRTSHRIPKLVSPVSYNIAIIPDMEGDNFTFHGKVEIDVKLDTNTSRIVLNVDKLDINDIKVSGMIGDQREYFEMYDYVIQPEIQQMTIYFKNLIPIPTAKIEIGYSGIITDDMQGFYRSSYRDSNGRLRWLLTTQFEPTYARRAFPCFDEPAYKATFTININRQNDYMALSNMPLAGSYPLANTTTTWDVFNESLPMSSYLVAFVISDFAPFNSNPYKTFNVYGRPEVVSYGTYAQEGGEAILKYLTKYTAIPQFIPKVDLIGIPDFAAGAMENWGLATFREYALFYDEEETSAMYTKYIATIISHELAHFWFGNLVTCDWWEYAWLNEGFAEYFEWIVSDEVYPGYQLMDQFVVYELQPALQIDVGKHPMNNPVSTPAEISGTFDKITYGKAASVLHMLRSSLGSTVFNFGIRDYLSKRAFKTATPNDLWTSIQKQVDKNGTFGKWSITVEDLMSTWTNNSGYPVVQAVLNYDRLTLYQAPFTYERLKPSGAHFWIPITLTGSLGPDFVMTRTKLWLGKEPMAIYVHPDNEWFLLNIRQSGFYRVNYDERSWSRLIKTLNSNQFEVIDKLNRAQIIDDLFNLARGDYIGYPVAFSATMYLIRETNHLPWKAFFNGMDYIVQRYQGHETKHIIHQHVLTVTHNVYTQLGFDKRELDGHLEELNRDMVLQWRCRLDHKECVDKATWLFAAWRDDNKQKLPPNLRSAFYCTAIRYGTDEDWYFLRDQYRKTQLASEQIIILKALACSNNNTLLHEYLSEAFRLKNRTSDIRVQDVVTVFSAVCNAHEVGLAECTNFFMLHYKKIFTLYKNWNNVASLFSTIASLISTDEQLTSLKNFVDNNVYGLGPIEESLHQSIAAAEKNYIWFSNYNDTIVSWLSARYQNGDNGGGGAAGNHGLHSILIVFIALISYFFI